MTFGDQVIDQQETRWWQLKDFYMFTPNPGEMIQFDEHIFQMGWFNHQPENVARNLDVFFRW